MITVKRSKLLNVNDLRVHYPVTGGIFFPKETGRIRAVDGISFDISPGETFSLVGESGSGKSTVAKSIVGLLENMYGDIVFDGTNINRTVVNIDGSTNFDENNGENTSNSQQIDIKKRRSMNYERSPTMESGTVIKLFYRSHVALLALGRIF